MRSSRGEDDTRGVVGGRTVLEGPQGRESVRGRNELLQEIKHRLLECKTKDCSFGAETRGTLRVLPSVCTTPTLYQNPLCFCQALTPSRICSSYVDKRRLGGETVSVRFPGRGSSWSVFVRGHKVRQTHTTSLIGVKYRPLRSKNDLYDVKRN